jgi:putative acetyltransferase
MMVVVVASGCKLAKTPSGFVAIRTDRQVRGRSIFPVAIDLSRVGTYPPDTSSGGGYFYDDVLEYRVWMNPDNGAQALNGNKDYFVAFAQYEFAKTFAERTPGAGAPLVLVRQRQWIDEPNRGTFIPQTTVRITEWQTQWLNGSRRTENSISEFLKHPIEAGP